MNRPRRYGSLGGAGSLGERELAKEMVDES